MRESCLFLVPLFAALSLTGTPVDFTDDFSSASLKGWGGMGGASAEIAPNGGRADGAGVVAANGEKGSGLSRSFPAVQGTYELIFWSRPVGVSGPIGVRGGVEFYDKAGKFVHPYFYETLSGKPDAFGWHKTVVRVPRVPEKAASIQIFCQLAPGSKGQVFFDDISFKSAVSPLLVSMVSPLNQTAAPGETVKMLLTRANGNLLFDAGVTARVAGPAGFPSQTCTVKDGRFSFVLPEVADGACPLSIELENAPATAVPKKLTLPLNVRRRARRTTFDTLGRLFVDGKPFMPLGFYTCSAFGTNVTDRLLECGGNTLLSYCTFGGLGNSVAAMRQNLRPTH